MFAYKTSNKMSEILLSLFKLLETALLTDGLGLEFSFHHILAVQPQATDPTSLCLNFLTRKMGIILVSTTKISCEG